MKTALKRLAVLAAAGLASMTLASASSAQVSDAVAKQAARSKQDPALKGVPIPPTVTPIEKIPVDKLKVPAGFKAEIWAHGMPGARTMVLGDKGTMFVGSRQIGRVYAVTQKDGKTETKLLLQGLASPNGLAFKDGALWVFAINKVFRYDGIEDKLDNPGLPVELTDKFNLPSDAQHGWKYVAFGPDGKLYVPVGANCNICEINPATHAHIRRYDPKDWSMEIVARGVRNTVGFDWHPTTKELWFTDNGRDWAGDAGPEDELNRVPANAVGANFGYPYCHNNGIVDPDVVRPQACAGMQLPAALTGPHSAGLGIRFYTGSMFPSQYKNVAFIARHGSWNRSKKFGYDVVVARPTANGKAKIEPFLTGLLDEKENKHLGRPAYVLPMADGSLLVSDEWNGAIFRISYAPTRTASR